MKTKFKGIKTAAEYKRGELAKNVLRLIGAGVAIGTVVVAPNMAQVIDYFHPRGRAEKKRIWNAIHHLERRGHLRVEERAGGQYVTLSDKGRQRLSEEMIWELALHTPLRWDKKWRLVMFDIPDRQERARRSFRLKLEDLGFLMYQKSVFIYPHECQNEVLAVAKWFGVNGGVRYVVATEIYDMRRFVQEFDLLS